MAYTACMVLEVVFTSATSDNDLTPPDLGSLLVSDLPNCLKNEENLEPVDGGPDSLPLKPVESCFLFSCECSNTLLSDFEAAPSIDLVVTEVLLGSLELG